MDTHLISRVALGKNAAQCFFILSRPRLSRILQQRLRRLVALMRSRPQNNIQCADNLDLITAIILRLNLTGYWIHSVRQECEQFLDTLNIHVHSSTTLFKNTLFRKQQRRFQYLLYQNCRIKWCIVYTVKATRKE